MALRNKSGISLGMTSRQAVNLLVLMVSLTPARILTLFLVPIALLYNIKKIKRDELNKLILFILIALTSTAMSEEILLLNLSVSLFFLLPFLLPLLLWSSVTAQIKLSVINNPLSIFFHVLLFNGFIGLIQYAIDPGDDAAIGFHGRAGLQMHGLAILYMFSAIYFYNQGNAPLSRVKIFLSLLFFVSCSYGMGFVALFISSFLALMTATKSKIKYLALFLVLTIALLFALYAINKSALLYNYSVLLSFKESISSIINNGYFQEGVTPRKLIAWLNYFELLSNDFMVFFTGVGGGGFNSRAAFMLNGDYSSISYVPTSIAEQHNKYIMPLWSASILSQQYQDGSMNQPFSSILSILAEYGIIGLALIMVCLLKVRRVMMNSLSSRSNDAVFSLNFCFFFIFIMGLFENIYEYSEIIFPFFILIHWIFLKAQKQKSIDS